MTRMAFYWLYCNNAMIVGVGIDLVKKSRIKSLLKRYGSSFLSKFLAPEEIAGIDLKKIEHLCGLIAAKEAVIKATSVILKQPLNFLNIVVCKKVSGGPCVEFRNIANLSKVKIFLSITHEADYSVAMAICEK